MRVLLVDESQSITAMMSNYLTLKGHDCTIVGKDGGKIKVNTELGKGVTLIKKLPKLESNLVIKPNHKTHRRRGI